MNLLLTGAWQGAKENISKLEEMGHLVHFLQYEKDELPCEYTTICFTIFLLIDICDISSCELL